MEIELSTQDEAELKSYGISENNKSTSIVTKDIIVWGYGDGNIIIFQRNLHLSNDQLNVIRNRTRLHNHRILLNEYPNMYLCDSAECGIDGPCASCMGKCKVTPQCNNKHDLQLISSKPEEYNEDDVITCDKCSEENIFDNCDFNYHCKSCHYDLCRMCAMTMKII